jgi:hypothetical protein
MTKRQPSATKLIARSSLGSPAVKKLRARTSASQRSQILRKAVTRQARDLPHGTTRRQA